MPFEEPEPSRILFDQGLYDFRITIPARREWGSFLFIGFWLCGWAVGEAVVGFVIFKGLYGVICGSHKWTALLPGIFVLAWFGMWTVGGVIAMNSWLWQLGGREVITLDPEALKVARVIPGWSRVKDYRISDVRNLRGVPAGLVPEAAMVAGKSGLAATAVVFDYGARTIAFGRDGLTEADTRRIVDEIAQRFPGIVSPQRFDSGVDGEDEP